MDSERGRRTPLRDLEARAEIAAACLERDTHRAVDVLRDHLDVLLTFEHATLRPPPRRARRPRAAG